MAMKLKEVHDSAMALPLRSRAKLAGDLIRSLDPEPSKKEQAFAYAEWEAEIKRRIDAYDRGEDKGISWEKVRAKMETKIHARKVSKKRGT